MLKVEIQDGFYDFQVNSIHQLNFFKDGVKIPNERFVAFIQHHLIEDFCNNNWNGVTIKFSSDGHGDYHIEIVQTEDWNKGFYEYYIYLNEQSIQIFEDYYFQGENGNERSTCDIEVFDLSYLG